MRSIYIFLIIILSGLLYVHAETDGITVDFTEILIPEEEDSRTTRSIAWGDYDNDGDLDLAVGNGGKVLIYDNESGSLLFNTEYPGPDLTSVAWGDCDNDGDLDLAVGNCNDFHCNYLLINRLIEGYHPDMLFEHKHWIGPRYTWSFAWCDYDNDGDLDLAVANGGNVNEPGRDCFWQNFLYINKDIYHFTAVPEFYYGCRFAWGDYDNDGDMDLAAGIQYGNQHNHLYINKGSGDFEDSEEFGGSATTAIAWGDCNNDGFLDLAVGNGFKERINYLYINDQQGSFIEIEQFNHTIDGENTSSLAWGDYDNDGDLDLAVGNQRTVNEAGINYIFINQLIDQDTLGFIGKPEFNHDTQNGEPTTCFSWGDYDNDGDIDLVAGNGKTGQKTNAIPYPNYLYINNLNNSDFLILKLAGNYLTKEEIGWSNRDGIGAKILIYEKNHAGDKDYLLGYRELHSNEGNGGVDSLDIEFGIPGQSTGHVDVLVKWPGSGGLHIEEYWTLALGQRYILLEGTGLATPTTQ